MNTGLFSAIGTRSVGHPRNPSAVRNLLKIDCFMPPRSNPASHVRALRRSIACFLRSVTRCRTETRVQVCSCRLLSFLIPRFSNPLGNGRSCHLSFRLKLIMDSVAQRFYCVFMTLPRIARFFSWLDVALSSIKKKWMNNGSICGIPGIRYAIAELFTLIKDNTSPKNIVCLTTEKVFQRLFDLLGQLGSRGSHPISTQMQSEFRIACIQWMISEIYFYGLKQQPGRAGVIFPAADNVDRAPLPNLAWLGGKGMLPSRFEGRVTLVPIRDTIS